MVFIKNFPKVQNLGNKRAIISKNFPKRKVRNMTNDQLDEHNAKMELLRLDGLLSEAVLLIGGLAVQRYVFERPSKDIDIVCDLSVQKTLLADAYSHPKYEKTERQTDLRPEYVITDNLTGNKIYLGAKIKERQSYPYINYDILAEDSLPFTYDNQKAENVRIPSPHALAFSKLISFISRRGTPKGQRDLEDFAKLTNIRQFSLNNFVTLSERMEASNYIDEFFRNNELNDDETSVLAMASPIRFQSILPVEILPSIYERGKGNTPVFNPVDTNFRFRSIELLFSYIDMENMKYYKTKRLTALKNNVGSFYDQFHWTGDQEVRFQCDNPGHQIHHRSPKNIWRRYEVDFQKILKEGDQEDVSLFWDVSDTDRNFVPFISVPIDNPTDRLELELDASAVNDEIDEVYVEIQPLMGAGVPVQYEEIVGEEGIYKYVCEKPRLLHTYEMRWNVLG